MPKQTRRTTRRYPTKKKTTTREGKRNYMKPYMRNYRRQRTQALQKLRTQHPDVFRAVFGKRKKEK